MIACGRSLLLTAGLLQLLTLVSCQTLNCLCEEERNRSQLQDLSCSTNELDQLDCNKAIVPNIPLGYEHVSGYGLYKLYATKRVQENARLQCELDGSRLAILQDDNQTAALTELITAKRWLSVAYIGFTDEGSEGTWYDIEGNLATYIPWIEGQPDNKENENCATLNTDRLANDVECDQLQAFICERPLNGEVPDDYTWVGNAGRFYKYHSDLLTFEEARASCQSEGASLAVPDTLLRAEEILDFVPRNMNWMWIGESDLETEGTFVTDEGRLVTDLEFQNWGTGQPNGGEAQSCVLYLRGGHLGDRECDEPHTYLCEIVPPTASAD